MDFKSLLISLCFLISINLYSQDGFFIYEKIPKGKVSRIEKKYNSKEGFSAVKHVFLEEDFAQPLNFSRPKTSNFKSVKVYYFYSENVVKKISYDWDAENNSDKEIFFKKYGLEFDKITAIVSKDIGRPQSVQEIAEKEDLVGTDTHFERRTVWENDKCEITMILLWSENHGVLFTTTINMKD